MQQDPASTITAETTSSCEPHAQPATPRKRPYVQKNKNAASMQQHANATHKLPSTRPRLQCDFCSKWYENRSSLKNHKYVCNARPNADVPLGYKCQTCDKSYYWLYQLKKHACKGKENGV